jgi:hypothetical protein
VCPKPHNGARGAQNAAYPGQIKRENGRLYAAAVDPTTNPSLFEVPFIHSRFFFRGLRYERLIARGMLGGSLRIALADSAIENLHSPQTVARGTKTNIYGLRGRILVEASQRNCRGLGEVSALGTCSDRR